MSDDDRIISKLSIAYPIEHIPPRGHVAKLSWQSETVPILIRTCSKEALPTVCVIERKGLAPIRVISEEGHFWWPVGSGGPDSVGFLGALHDGHRDVVGLVGARLRKTYNWKMETNVQSREVIHSWRDDAIARAHRAAESILLVDGQWPHIRGGTPALIGTEAFNTGFEYGRPLPVNLTGHKGAYWVDESNLRSNVALGFAAPVEELPFLAPAIGQSDGDRIGCKMHLPAIDVAQLQLRLLCRNLIENLDDNRHLPLDVRRRGFALHGLHHSEPGFDDCVDAIIEVRGWLSGLGPELRHKFRDASRLLKLWIPRIDQTLHRQRRPCAFAIEPTEDDAVASLLIR